MISSTAMATAVVDAALESHGIEAGGHGLEAFLHDAVGEDGGRSGAVAGDVVGLGGDFLEELGAHVLVGVLELDFLGYRNAVLGDGGRAELFVEEDIAALGSEGDLYRLGDSLDADEELAPRVFTEQDLLGHSLLSPFLKGNYFPGRTSRPGCGCCFDPDRRVVGKIHKSAGTRQGQFELLQDS